ncbi:putative endonuclease/exonuclease/phosphatase [Helianthus annuus]|uniref:Endonuclease/exonuclease/phosphatase n=2 Tax=Helianthus annuus TaxID=4232 RepID=A0A251TFQ3_HELAN|nr:putative endonuclease/exonuclease/phosphatase [Helianthus annuus]KAJ0512641.1 putative endonuclease/exonuclease/phosphatase [Helianthus annuus]KAJ0528770.1 putative endonuclease/exonuclease/phosphatase [Helianthus annuus]KAJ0695684.1 putative endonuclease/exonuclease/phosphatase [Helianthus annuus]
MRDEFCKKSKFDFMLIIMKVSWPKTLKKWFNVKNKSENFHADDFSYGGGDEVWRNNFSEKEVCSIKESRNTRTERSSKRSVNYLQTNKIDPNLAEVRDVDNYRIFVATWNVAGKSPTNDLNLEDWLHTSPSAHIYVLGFQEIVPLNAGNVLGTEDNGPAKKWLALIQKTLNTLPETTEIFHNPSPTPDPLVESDSDLEDPSSLLNRRLSFQSQCQSMRFTGSDMAIPYSRFESRYSVSDRVVFGTRPSGYDPGVGSSDEDNGSGDSDSGLSYDPVAYCGNFLTEERDKVVENNNKYCLVASKQMVGIYLTIWVKSDLRDHVRNMKVSCVGRGLMGYLGNKGSISISMSLHQTSFCFICSHLTSGQKDGDELRRNCDVMEIMRKTRFPRDQETGDENSPQTILDHDRIIWLGDLNYRIALSYRSAKALVEMRNWRALLEKDQLRIQRRRGRIFQGWNEGCIYFPPTYKYSNNSDRYAGYDTRPKEKRRTPAWCDRILWYGNGLRQMSYVRGESRFSDHRPVYSIFLAEVESINSTQFKKNISYSSRIEVEELLPFSCRYKGLSFY